jgi:hypothetical protein
MLEVQDSKDYLGIHFFWGFLCCLLSLLVFLLASSSVNAVFPFFCHLVLSPSLRAYSLASVVIVDVPEVECIICLENFKCRDITARLLCMYEWRRWLTFSSFVC